MSGIQELVARARREAGESAHAELCGLFAPITSSPEDGEEPADRHVGRSVEGRDELLRRQRVIAGFDDDRVEPYRQLRTQLLRMMHDHRWNTLAITSAHEGAGKTLTAVNLAISVAAEFNHSVLLVDLDLRTPTVHEKLDFSVTTGFVDYLRGAAELEDVVVRPGYPRLTVLPGRPLGKFSSELLSSPKMNQFMASVCGHYDRSRIVIFDLPPVLRNDDALLFAPKANATLMVVEDAVTTDEQLRHCLSLLTGANVVGTVLNKARD